MIKANIQVFNDILDKVKTMIKIINQIEKKNPQGRKLALTQEEIIALGIFKQTQGIKTKKAIYEIFQLTCSYKTLVVNLNRFSFILPISH